MDIPQDPDMLSGMKDLLLIMIISYLPFKDAVRTSVLSKRWKNLCYQTRNVQFNETDFVDLSASEENKLARRALFVRFMSEWVSWFYGDRIDSFEVKFSKPDGFQGEMKSLIRFAVSKSVKNLVLDFSCGSENQVTAIDLPSCVYEKAKLESLNLYACGLVASSFKNMTSLKNLSLGFVELGSVQSLLMNTPLLESLTLRMCRNVDLVELINNERLRELIIENCDFTGSAFYFDVPCLEVFKYSGEFCHIVFDRLKRRMQEVCLDFGLETEFEETGEILCNILYDVASATTLTVCTYLLQEVPNGENPLSLDRPLETRCLTLKTSLYPHEFLGIRFMLKSCYILESLTLEIVPERILVDYYPPFEFDPDTLWEEKIIYRCLKNTLRVVKIKGFRGILYDLRFLQYLLRFGRVLQCLELHVSPDVGYNERIVALAGADTVNRRFRRASKNLVITVHNN
ncbi:PREDICTED: putative F-box/LRR-repeat protein At1g56400 [Tarenaya hassleriana]|uniref:putative F-box/LRR-repeat protein At1g56400 n=1 Tax=Tarenaya hassleriana TaxID=28532 RepID=UPI00053C3B11|nr:PREDICTED: putative F-box/LRR-repeat protein At1g56400 [Tarenaya hassleriana]